MSPPRFIHMLKLAHSKQTKPMLCLGLVLAHESYEPHLDPD